MDKKSTSLPPWTIKDCKDFAKYQSYLLVVMLMFVGFLCLTPMTEKLGAQKKNASVEKVWYNDGSISIVDLQVGKTFHEKKMVGKPLNENDIVVVYVSKNKQLSFAKPDDGSANMFRWSFWVLLILSIGVAISLTVVDPKQ